MFGGKGSNRGDGCMSTRGKFKASLEYVKSNRNPTILYQPQLASWETKAGNTYLSVHDRDGMGVPMGLVWVMDWWARVAGL